MNSKTRTQQHIGLNAQLLSLGQNYRGAGISWYIYNLLTYLGQDDADLAYTAFLNEKQFKPGPNMQARFSPFSTHNPLARILWEQTLQPIALKQQEVDLFHALAFAAPLTTHCPFVVTIYDLSFRHFPEAFRPFNRFYLNTLTSLTAKRAARIITISESTRQDVMRFYSVDPNRVQTIYCGVDDSFQPLPSRDIDAFKTKHNLPDRFILFLGTIEPRKNVVGLLKAYAVWIQRDAAAPLLVVGGGKGWYYQQVFEWVEKLGLQDRVRFPGYLPQADLRLWYNAANIFVYPSLFEGFGLPVLEAMACGTPVITSNVSSLPEVAGDAAVLIDPHNTDALSAAMEQVYSQPTTQQTMAEKGLRQRVRFSWQKTATETRKVYQTVLAG
ncbi:MAG: glycosyltransferase family 1 protein [Chloroflexota bacterium]